MSFNHLNAVVNREKTLLPHKDYTEPIVFDKSTLREDYRALAYLESANVGVQLRCATTHRQTTDRKSTRRQKLTDKKIFTDTTTERQRQVADTTTHRQKPIIFLYISTSTSLISEGHV